MERERPFVGIADERQARMLDHEGRVSDPFDCGFDLAAGYQLAVVDPASSPRTNSAFTFARNMREYISQVANAPIVA